MRENIKRHKVFIEHISTELKITNPMIKSLLIKQYQSHVEHMRLINSLCTYLPIKFCVNVVFLSVKINKIGPK
jgi:hypothetical protein